MKKCIISTFLVVILCVFCSPVVFAAEGVAFFAPFSSYASFSYDNAHHISYEALLDMLAHLSYDEGNAVSGTNINNSNVIIYDVEVTTVAVGSGSRCVLRAYDKSLNTYMYGGYEASTFYPYWCYVDERVDISDVHSALYTTYESTLYSVADFSRHIFNRLGTIDDHLDSWLSSVDGDSGKTYSVAAWSKHIFNRLGSINDALASALYSADNDSGKTYSVAAWSKHIFNRLGTLDEHFSSWFTSVDNDSGKTYSVADWSRHIYNRVGTMNTNLGGKLDNIYSRLNTTNGYIDGLEGKLDTVNTRLTTLNTSVTSGFTTMNGYVDGLEGVAANIYARLGILDSSVTSGFSGIGDKLDTTNTRLTTLNTSVTSGFSGIGCKLDTVIDLMTANHYFTGFATDPSGAAFPTQSIPYDAAVQIVAKFNSEMIGKKVTILKRDGSGTLEYTVKRAALQSTGRITVFTTNGANYWLCDSENTIFIADAKMDYSSSIANIYSRLGVVDSSINSGFSALGDKLNTANTHLTTLNTSVTSGFSGIGGKLDTVIDLMTANHYFTGYATDPSGAAFPTQSIPYDAAVQIVSKFNSDMIGKKVTILKRDGSGTIDAIVSRAALQQTGRITVYTTGGNNYWLCDNRNTIFIADPKTDYNSSIANVYTRLGTIDTNLGGKLDNIYSRLNTTNGYIDGVESKLDTANTRLSTLNSSVTSGFTTMNGYVDGLEGSAANMYTRLGVVDSSVNSGFSALGDKLNTTNARLSTLNASIGSGFSGIGGKLDTVIDLMTTNHYFTGYATDPSGAAFPTQSIPYDAAVQIVAKFNSDMIGKKVTILKRDGSGTIDAIVSRAAIQQTGRITVYTTGGNNYWLCDNRNTIFIADAKTDYSSSITSIYSRMSDLISAVNNLSVGVDLSDVSLSVDASSINVDTYNVYCCSYLTDSAGSSYSAYTIPYDTAVDMVARLNTECVGDKFTLLRRTGGTSTGYIRSASILSNGYIQVCSNSGSSFYLCDNANVLFKVDTSSNYGDRIDNNINNVLDRLDTIIANQQNDIGLTSCSHHYLAEVSQEPTCVLPGLMVYTCDLCGASYSEIMESLGHDWLCTDHVEPVKGTDGEVIQSGYDIYTCQICQRSYYDYDHTGAPENESGHTITDLISQLFGKIGSFFGGLLSSVINMLDKLLTGFDHIISSFNEKTQQIINFGGDYPAWLGGIWSIMPTDFQLALGFCVLCLALGIIGKKTVFA